MTRSTVGLIAVGAMLFVVQRSVLMDVKIFGVYLDLLLLFAVCVGISCGADRGAVAGFIIGLADDAFLISPLGLCAFAFAIAGYLAGAVSDETTKLPGVIAITAAASSALAFLVVLVISRVTGELGVSVGHGFVVLFVVSSVNAVLAPALCRGLRTFSAGNGRRRDRELVW